MTAEIPSSPEPPQRPPRDWRVWLRRVQQASRQMAGILVGEGESPLADMRAAFGHLRPSHLVWSAVTLLVAGYLLTGVYVVDPGEVGIVRRFGAVAAAQSEPGLHYRLPWPVDRVDMINVNEVLREEVGVLTPEANHDHPEPSEKLQVLSGDTNVIDIELIAQYQVRDPVAFLLNVRYAPYRLIRDVARQAVTEMLSRQPVDAILTAERLTLQEQIRVEMQRQLDVYESGLVILGINLQKAFPPDEVADAFTDVNSAREDKARAINEATGYANSRIPEARGQAQQMLADAQGYQSDTLGRATGAAQAFESVLAEYGDNSRIYGEEVTRYRLYLETLDTILARVQLYVVDGENGGQVNLRLFGTPSNAAGNAEIQPRDE